MINRFTRIILMGLMTISAFVYTDINAAITTINDFKVPDNFRFTKNLFLGQTLRPDVSYLQNILNMNINTQVATGTDAGSNANLTNYYGQKTKNAVGKFQSLFANDIKNEFILLNPTIASSTVFRTNSSIIDIYTMKVLNKLISTYNFAKKSTTTDEIVDDKSDSNTAVIAAAIGIGAAAIAAGAMTETAAKSTPLQPFGGVSTSMIICTCSANTLIYVKDPRGFVLPLIYQPGVTVLYKMYNPTVGVNMLGKYVPGGVCLIYVGTGCSTAGTPAGTMMQVGTSVTI